MTMYDDDMHERGVYLFPFKKKPLDPRRGSSYQEEAGLTNKKLRAFFEALN